MIGRRSFITVLGGAAAWPLGARAQQPATVGFLGSQATGPMSANRVAAFRQGLAELSYVEGRNVTVDFRWAEGHYERLPVLAADLVRRNVAVIAATTQDAALAAKKVTATIPIVFNVGGDPVATGLVASLARPGGNATGTSMFTIEVVAKCLGLLHEMAPAIPAVGALINPSSSSAESQSRALHAAAHSLGLQLLVRNVSSEQDFDAAFEGLVQAGAGALFVSADPFMANRRDQIIMLAAKFRLPAIYEWADFVESGGLMSYGTSIIDAYRQVGVYVGKVLKGEKPADLPVMRPVKFELAINLRTAKSMGIEVPAMLLARADEVIE